MSNMPLSYNTGGICLPVFLAAMAHVPLYRGFQPALLRQLLPAVSPSDSCGEGVDSCEQLSPTTRPVQCMRPRVYMALI